MTTNVYLDSVLYPLCKLFKGTYSCNNIPYCEGDSSFIVNLSERFEKGTHFICIVKRAEYVYYFDSYGLRPLNTHIIKYLHSLKIPIYYNDIKIQDDNSVFCGLYCMLQVLSTDKHCKINTSFKFHTHGDLSRNDDICVDYILSIIKSMKE